MKPAIKPPAVKLHDDATGEVFVLQELSVIGRSRESTVPVPDPRVSRRHAMIRRQNDGYWFFDLGSVNGSLLNGRRVTTSQLLANGDMIQIADRCFRFESGSHPGGMHGESSIAERTLADVRSRTVILLVSDIQGFTTIAEKLTPDQLAPIIGSWYARTASILERHGANLDKFIGDCVLGYWLDTAPASRLAALKAAHAMRMACDEVQDQHRGVLEPLGLRFGSGAAVHMGPAAYGAFGPREFTLLGDAVNLAFRLEALTRLLDQRVVVSADLFAGWSAGLSCCRQLGAHPVKGRSQEVEVYALECDPEGPVP
ncbi:MAG: adenylate/guanylate cyclase domain-containing protein [Verrucomicrobia bacterium]|nr:adenylate/guanylate cyclase domain-containing protein [Verrucomicrobiota bacterium]